MQNVSVSHEIKATYLFFVVFCVSCVDFGPFICGRTAGGGSLHRQFDHNYRLERPEIDTGDTENNQK